MNVSLNKRQVFLGTGGVDFNPDLPCIVFIHGAAMDHTFWTLHSRYFARNGYCVLTPDLPGHGSSEGEALQSIGELARWLISVLDHLSVSRVALAGHSMGSLTALESAASYPERVDSLVLMGTAYPMRVSDALLDASRENHRSAFDMVTLFGTAYRTQIGSNPFAGVNVVNSCLRLLEKSKPGSLYNALTACNSYDRGEEAAQRIRCPTTLIVGQQDSMTPPKAAYHLAKSINNSKIIEIPECGHMHPYEQPEASHQALVKAFSATG